MQKHTIESEEEWLGLGFSQPYRKEWFGLKQIESYQKQEGDPTKITFGLDQDVKVYKRSIYTILDFLGDLGGLLDALKAVVGILVTIFFKMRGDPVNKFLIKSV